MASVECVRLKVRCDGRPGETCSRCRNRARSCRYRSQVDSLDLDQTRSLSPRRVASPTDLSEEVLDFDSEFMQSTQSGLQFSPANQPAQPSISCPGNLSGTSPSIILTSYYINILRRIIPPTGNIVQLQCRSKRKFLWLGCNRSRLRGSNILQHAVVRLAARRWSSHPYFFPRFPI